MKEVEKCCENCKYFKGLRYNAEMGSYNLICETQEEYKIETLLQRGVPGFKLCCNSFESKQQPTGK